MVVLTIYQNNSGRRKSSQTIMFDSIQNAIGAGQSSGSYYDIFDTSTGRLIDWDEVNVQIEDGWYYDETELIWKKCQEEQFNENWLKKGIDWLFDTKNEEQGNLVF